MTEIFVNNVKIDLTENVPVPLTFSVADITQPDKRNTAFSKTIVVPSSKTNDQLFSWIFEISKEALSTVNGQNFTPDFNPMLKADCKIFEDNILQFSGIIQLLEIKIDNGIISYETVVFGSLRNIFANLEDYLLENLDMSEFDHTWNRTNMKASWTATVGTGYVYPTIDYGFGQSMTRLNSKHIFPAVYVREYFIKMFAIGGYDWNSNFLDSNFFKRLIIPYSGGDTVKLTNAVIAERSFQAQVTVTQNINYNRPALNVAYPVTVIRPNPIIFNNDSTGGNFDNFPAYDNTTGIWVCPASGYYSFAMAATATLTTSTGNLTLQFGINYLNTNISKYGTLARQNFSTNGTTLTATCSIVSSNKYLEKGTIVYGYVGGETTNSAAVNIGIDVTAGIFYNSPISLPLNVGDTMLVNSSIPTGIKCKDFFTSIIKMFNLYVQPDPDDENKLNIEPLVEFYNNDTIDWTSKVDYSKQVLIKPVSQIEGKQYEFKYKQDNDLYNTLYRTTYEAGYGDKTVEVVNDFVSQKKTTEIVFSATPSVGTQINSMVIPRIVTQDQKNLEIQPYKANIRILYYGGVKSAGGSWKWVENGTVYTETTYAYAGHLDDPFTPTIDLLWQKPREIFWGSPSDIGLGYTTNNIYNKYWSQFINEITDKDSKVVTYYVRLRPIDVFQLDFRRPIYINGVEFRLNKIIDYDPQSQDTVKVELSKIKRYAAFIPDTDEVISQNDPLNYDILEGGLDEVRSLTPISPIHLVEGSIDQVIGISGESLADLINGG
jgi:hypothetical protein